jgi:hypothetical protein
MSQESIESFKYYTNKQNFTLDLAANPSLSPETIRLSVILVIPLIYKSAEDNISLKEIKPRLKLDILKYSNRLRYYTNTIDQADLNKEAQLYLQFFYIIYSDLKKQDFWEELNTFRAQYYSFSGVELRLNPSEDEMLHPDQIKSNNKKLDRNTKLQFWRTFRDFQSFGKDMESFYKYLVEKTSRQDLKARYSDYLQSNIKLLEASRKIAEIYVYFPNSELRSSILQFFKKPNGIIDGDNFLSIISKLDLACLSLVFVDINNALPELKLFENASPIDISWVEQDMIHPVIVHTFRIIDENSGKSVESIRHPHFTTQSEQDALLFESHKMVRSKTNTQKPKPATQKVKEKRSKTDLRPTLRNRKLENAINKEVSELLNYKGRDNEFGNFWNIIKIKEVATKMGLDAESVCTRAIFPRFRNFVKRHIEEAETSEAILYIETMIQNKILPRIPGKGKGGDTNFNYIHKDLVLALMDEYKLKFNLPEPIEFDKNNYSEFTSSLRNICRLDDKNYHAHHTNALNKTLRYLEKTCIEKGYFTCRDQVDGRKKYFFPKKELFHCLKIFNDTIFKDYNSINSMFEKYSYRFDEMLKITNIKNPNLEVKTIYLSEAEKMIQDFVASNHPKLQTQIYFDDTTQLKKDQLIFSSRISELFVTHLLTKPIKYRFKHQQSIRVKTTPPSLPSTPY